MTGGAALEAGAVVGDRYRLRRPLGEGGMGWVWEASHVFTHKRFALKFLKGAKEEDRRRFVREVRAAAAVKHPNVIGVHDFVELPNGTLVMVMDLLEGETLGQVLKRKPRIELPELAAILLPIVSALEAAHAAGIVHRDLKPDNVFLSEKERENDEGKDIEVKVLDFGVAKLTALEGLAARTQALTGTGSMVGTPYYMSPEQVVSEKDLDARADIWSLGVMMYECLAGVRPTEADNVGRVLKRIILADFQPIAIHCNALPEDVATIVTNMLVGDRDKRTRALSEVRAVLERHAAKAIPASTRIHSPASENVDAHADTVANASERPDVRARGETNQAVTIASTGASRARARLLGAVGVALVVGFGIFGWSIATKTTTPPPAVVATPPMPSIEIPITASAAPATSASAEALGASPSASASASVSAVSSGHVPATRPRGAATRPVVMAAASAPNPAPVPPARPAVAAASAASAAPPSSSPKPPPGYAASRKE